MAQGQALGLPTEVQRDSASGAENVIVRMPGTADSARDVLITAHYDSADAAPGAADDGMAVAAMLEAMRAVRAGEPLANDVVFLFTDGEEHGQTGIAAFVRDHPAADRVGVAFAFEGLPESSGTLLQTTTPGDAWLVRELRRASLPIFANSAHNTSDRDRAGNDFAAFAPAGIVGAEFMNEGSQVRYHNAGDNVAAIEAGVVQDQGDTMLALIRHFGVLDLTAARTTQDDLIFFTVPGLGLVAYPISVATVLAAVAAAALVWVVVMARRRGRLRGARLAWATLIIAAMVVLLTTLAWVAWQSLLTINPESARTLHYPDFDGSAEAMAGIYALAAVVFVTACHRLARRITSVELAAGVLLWWLLLVVLLTVAEPLFSAIALWPLAGGIIALAAIALIRPLWLRGGLLAFAALPGLALLVPLLVLEAVNVGQGPLVAVPVLLLLSGSLLPQLLLIVGGIPPPVAHDDARDTPAARARTPLAVPAKGATAVG